MGVKGLWQYLEHHNLTYLPPSESDEPPRQLRDALRPRHLLLDMNALLHISYSAQRPSSRATIQAVRTRVVALLRRLQPSTTLVLVFDGTAPAAKMAEQKERRKALSPGPPAAAPKPSAAFTDSALGKEFTCDYANTHVPLRQEHISAGSEFVLACERILVDLLKPVACSHEGDGTPSPLSETSGSTVPGSWTRLLVSSSTEPGEGEVKISRYIRRLWQEGVQSGTYTPEDAITIVGNDSDLVLVALVATPYRRLSVVDPDDFSITCLNELFDHWGRSLQHPPLPADLLPSWRLDFVFLMMLAGCDYYDGVRRHAVELWRRYRDLRANHGFYRRQLVSGVSFDLDIGFLRSVTEKVSSFMPQSGRQKGGPHRRSAACNRSSGGEGNEASAAHGRELLRAALWNFKSCVLGGCVDYEYVSPIKHAGEISVGALRAAAQRAGLAQAMRADAEAGHTLLATPPLSVLEQYVAVLGNRGRYSREIQLTLDVYTDDGGLKLTQSQSTRHLIETVRALMLRVNADRLSGAERALLARDSGSAGPEQESAVDAAGFMVHAQINRKGRAAATATDSPISPESAAERPHAGGAQGSLLSPSPPSLSEV